MEAFIPPLPEDVGYTWSNYTNERVKLFLEYAVRLCRPKAVTIFDGAQRSYTAVCDQLEAQGVLLPLNPFLFPRSYLARSEPNDTARSEERTFVCGPESLYSVPATAFAPHLGFSWGCRAGDDVRDPTTGASIREMTTEEMRAHMKKEFSGCMEGRTMWIIPLCMGPIGSDFCKYAIQVTDSAYVVAHTYIMARTGSEVLRELARGASFVPCWHSVGVPLGRGEKDVPWPCRRQTSRKYICHFTCPDPEIPMLGAYHVMSIGSGYGGNALLGKKCIALRIASRMAAYDPVRWMAEHMLILHVRYTPKADPLHPRDYYLTGAFPSACGKTNLAMLEVPKPFQKEWQITTLGDDIAWMRIDEKGCLSAVNPESGFFGVAPGTSDKSNHYAMDALRLGNTIFTNVAVTRDGDVWWRDKTDRLPKHLIDWQGRPCAEPASLASDPQALSDAMDSAAQKNSRYTTPCAQCPIIDPAYIQGRGVPIDAILFGGRRRTLVPLACRTTSWMHGVLMASTLRSEQTAASVDRPEGSLTFDPMAMRPFVGYNMGHYFQHWLDMGHLIAHPPAIYCVNWFRRERGEVRGRFLWPGFSQNFRVIKWICSQIDRARAGVPLPAANTPLGIVPSASELEVVVRPSGIATPDPAAPVAPLPPTALVLDESKTSELLTVNAADASWVQELKEVREYITSFGPDMPEGLKAEFNAHVQRFAAMGMTPESANELLLRE